jgi:hypothetical protein
VLGSPLNSLVLARVRIDYEWVILVQLHWEFASSGARCLSCRLVVLVTLGGCHLLDGLVTWSQSKHANKLVRCSREDCEGCCARPAGAMKSNSSRARHEGRQVVRPSQSARAYGKQSTWESVTCGSQVAKRTGINLEACLNGDYLVGKQENLRIKIIVSTLFIPLVCNPLKQACTYSFIYCACVIALVIS